MQKIYQTRMHSSRMRTGRSLTVCWSVLAGGGVWSWGGGHCSGGGGSPCPVGGGSGPRRGVCLLWGGSPCPETPPVNRITHTCKNITLATTSLWPVTRMLSSRMRTTRLLPVSPSMHCLGVVYLPRRVYLLRGTCQGVLLPRGLCTCQGVYLPREVYLPGGYLPRYPPVNRILDIRY